MAEPSSDVPTPSEATTRYDDTTRSAASISFANAERSRDALACRDGGWRMGPTITLLLTGKVAGTQPDLGSAYNNGSYSHVAVQGVVGLV